MEGSSGSSRSRYRTPAKYCGYVKGPKGDLAWTDPAAVPQLFESVHEEAGHVSQAAPPFFSVHSSVFAQL